MFHTRTPQCKDLSERTSSSKVALMTRLRSVTFGTFLDSNPTRENSSSNEDKNPTLIAKLDSEISSTENYSITTSTQTNGFDQEQKPGLENDITSCEGTGDLFSTCDTIDDSMLGLHTYLQNIERALVEDLHHSSFEYDWILDGDILTNDCPPSVSLRMNFGDDLDQTLRMMELEDRNIYEDEEVIEFADFSNLDFDIPREKDDNRDDWEKFVSAEILASNMIRSQTDCNLDKGIEKSNGTIQKFNTISLEETHQFTSTVGVFHSISEVNQLSLVRSDMFNDNCCSLPSCNDSASAGKKISSDHVLKNKLHVDEIFSHNEGKDLNGKMELHMNKTMQPAYKQPLLMSHVLLNSLPISIPDMNSDLAASFTYRLQSNHRDTADDSVRNATINATTLVNEYLEKDLGHIIHSGYFSNPPDDDEHFDSIVLDEILNIPWPFHEITLNEPIIEDYSNLDSEGSGLNQDFHFDSYISNRLSQLDLANDRIITSIFSLVKKKKNDIDAGTKHILAAEWDITTALLFANSSREYLNKIMKRCLINNYKNDVRNPIMGGFNVIQCAHRRDKLRYLLDTIDQISVICEQEASFWRNVSKRMNQDYKTKIHLRYRKLIQDARKLKQKIFEEEVLNHIDVLQTMRDRIDRLPEVLLRYVEESLAELLNAILQSNAACEESYIEFSTWYETLLNAWVSCYRLSNYCHSSMPPSSGEIAAQWSGCILKILCFEISRSYVCSWIKDFDGNDAIDNLSSGEQETLYEIKARLHSIKFNSSDDTDLDKLLQQLRIHLDLRRSSDTFSSTFCFLSSCLAEVLCLYCLLLQWHDSLGQRTIVHSNPLTTENNSCYDHLENDSQHTIISSISSDEVSSCASLIEETFDDDASSEEESKGWIPGSFQFKDNADKSSSYLLDEIILKNIHKSLDYIRHPLFEYCKSTLVQKVNAFMSASHERFPRRDRKTDLSLDSLIIIEDAFQQFKQFSQNFLGERVGCESSVCDTIKNELLKLYHMHLHTVHLESMKITETLLMHESWQLSPLDLTDVCRETENTRAHDEPAIMVNIYKAVSDLLFSFIQNKIPAIGNRYILLERDVLDRYGQCHHINEVIESKSTMYKYIGEQQLRECVGVCSKSFASFIQQFLEKKPCGGISLSLLTQSSVYGLFNWTGQLLAIGISLPSIASDVSAALESLFDLYILTVFRLCARNRENEDILTGLSKRSLPDYSRKSSSRDPSCFLSITVEADICAPLPCEMQDFEHLQKYLHSSRKRLEGVVDLEKLESCTDYNNASARCKIQPERMSKKLEKCIAAAVSTLLSTVLYDVASQVLKGVLKEVDLSQVDDSCSYERMESFTIQVVSMAPYLIRQSCRFMCVHALYGKDIVLQVMCLEKCWLDHDIKENSNSFADDLHELCGELWGLLSSSSEVPIPVIKYTWDQLLFSSFSILLESFAKILSCSTEGRSLMSMDLAALSHGLNPDTVQKYLSEAYPLIIPPHNSGREEAMRYVDAYVKVFYFPDEDILHWIKENSRNYHYEYLLSLMTVKSTSNHESAAFWANRKVDLNDLCKT